MVSKEKVERNEWLPRQSKASSALYMLMMIVVAFISGILGSLLYGWGFFRKPSFTFSVDAGLFGGQVEISHSIKSADAISIANTYIVYSTFVVVVVSLLLLLVGYIMMAYYEDRHTRSEELFRQKMVEALDKNDDLSLRLLASVLERPEVVEKIEERLYQFKPEGSECSEEPDKEDEASDSQADSLSADLSNGGDGNAPRA